MNFGLRPLSIYRATYMLVSVCAYYKITKDMRRLFLLYAVYIYYKLR